MPAKATVSSSSQKDKDRERLIHAKIVAAIAAGGDPKNVGLLEAMQGFAKLYKALESVNLNVEADVGSAMVPHQHIINKLKAILKPVAPAASTNHSTTVSNRDLSVKIWNAFLSDRNYKTDYETAARNIDTLKAFVTVSLGGFSGILEPLKPIIEAKIKEQIADLEGKVPKKSKQRPESEVAPPFSFAYTPSGENIESILDKLVKIDGIPSDVKTAPSNFTVGAVSPFKESGFAPYPIPISAHESDINIMWFVNKFKGGVQLISDLDETDEKFITQILDIISQYVNAKENKQTDKYSGVAHAVQMNMGKTPNKNKESYFLGSLFYIQPLRETVSATPSEYYRNFLL